MGRKTHQISARDLGSNPSCAASQLWKYRQVGSPPSFLSKAVAKNERATEVNVEELSMFYFKFLKEPHFNISVSFILP